MRRTHLRHHDNILKRLLVHVGGLNLALLMRTIFGVGKPRCLQGRPDLLRALLARAYRRIDASLLLWAAIVERCSRLRSILAGVGSSDRDARVGAGRGSSRGPAIQTATFTSGC